MLWNHLRTAQTVVIAFSQPTSFKNTVYQYVAGINSSIEALTKRLVQWPYSGKGPLASPAASLSPLSPRLEASGQRVADARQQHTA